MKKIFLLCVIMLLLVGCKTPHIHEFIEGICECGEMDPDYQVHNHNYVHGVCDCGKVNPNYPGHEHDYVDGVCACGEIYIVPKPDEIIYVDFESVNDLINDYAQKKEEYKYNYLVLNCDDIIADTLQHVTYMNYGIRNYHEPVDGMIFHYVKRGTHEISEPLDLLSGTALGAVSFEHLADVGLTHG